MEYEVPDRPLVSIEHPCIINSTANAIRSLGGDRQLHKLVTPLQEDAQARLYLRPDDALAAPILSEQIKTSDLLLQVTVPKLVRRRKKRDANAVASPPRADSTQGPDGEPKSLPWPGAKRLLRSLRDNPERCSFQFIGCVQSTHRFRNMPDFAYATSTGPFVQEYTDKVVPMRYDLLKQFAFNPSASPSQPTELIPPPRLSHFQMPFNYRYRQNPAMKKVINSSGTVELVNEQVARKTYTPRLSCDAASVPSHPPSYIPSFASLDPDLKACVQELRARFEERPIWTRRALSNSIARDEWRHLYKYAYEHVTYMFRSGPWGQAVIKLGVDPRTDQKYRIYQTMSFQFDDDGSAQKGAQKGKQKEKAKAKGHAASAKGGAREREPDDKSSAPRTSHVFDGSAVGLDGRVWQVCDICEPLVQTILATESLRRECHVRSDGWYHNGTWAKARTITKAKMLALVKAQIDAEVDDTFERIAALPDIINSATKDAAMSSRKDTQMYIDLATAVRGMASSPEGESRGGSSWETGVNGSGEAAIDMEDYGAGGDEDESDPRVASALREIRRQFAEQGQADEYGEEEITDEEEDEDNEDG